MQQVADFIQAVGFPTFVAVYVLMRLEPTISKLDKTIKMQTIIIAEMSGLSYVEIKRKYGIKADD